MSFITLSLRVLPALFLFLSISLHAQVTGKITSQTGEELPFVNIYLKGASLGTTSNAEGDYILHVSAEGDYVVVFQFLGFQTKEIRVQVDTLPYSLNVQLAEETTSLDEVLLTSNINPADAIIRAVIANKSTVREKLRAYTANFYSRGLWKVENVPESILGQEIGDLGGGLDSTRTGIIYLSETISKIAFKAPDDFKETIVASKVSGDSNGFSFNSAQEADFSFYNNTIDLQAQLVSPIADNAFGYYNYRLVGNFYEGGALINKIEVTPKRVNDRVFNGTIYVVEDLWQLYGAELNTTGAAIQVPLVEKLQFKHNFKYDAAEKLWVKISQTIDFSFKLLGFGGNGRFTAVYSDYDFKPNFTKKSFSNEVLSFKPEANKKDSLFWNGIRPVPLSMEERGDYVKKDSLQVLRKTKKYLDSIDGERNRFKLVDLAMGYDYANTHERWGIAVEGPIRQFNFNTIQGWNLTTGATYRSWKEDYASVFNLGFTANYGFAEDRVRFTGTIAKRFNRTNKRTLSLTGGNAVRQFNRSEPITPLGNTLVTLLYEKNYLKAYDLTFAEANYSEELFNGFRLFASLAYERRQSLFNNTDYVFLKNDTNDYNSNNPLAPFAYGTSAITKHEIAKVDLTARINFGQKYLSYPDGKFNVDNDKYPTLYLGVEQGFAASSGSLNYTQLRTKLTQDFNMGNKGKFAYVMRAGTFFNADDISFIDYQHFESNKVALNISKTPVERFNNLSYYELSTNRSYWEAHVEHDFKGYILGKIPGLRALNLNLIAGANFLATAQFKPYKEVSVGLGNIGFGKFRLLRLDYVRSFYEGSVDNLIILGITLPR